MIYTSKIKTITFLIVTLLFISGKVFCQSSSYGNTYIFNTSEIGIIDIQHNFFNGGSGIQPGIVGTDRTSIQGFLSFVGTASWTGASNSAFVDGYVKSYLTSAFTFPIGDNNKYRPAAISAASLANPANAAYYGVSATTAITSKLRGGNEPVLPAGGPFNTSLMGAGVGSVDNVEYWDINGTTSAKITLTWDATSAITSLTSLTILGWNGTQWVAIASTVDSTSLLGGSSTLNSGSITTNANLVPDNYSVYTLGTICNAGTTAPVVSSNTITNTCPTTTVNLNSLVTSNTPSGTSIVWFTNNNHTGSAYATPTTAVAGTYYPFYYDSVNSCYSPVGAMVTVTITVPTVGGSISSNQTICSGSAPSDLTLSGNTGSVVKWQKSTNSAFTSPIDISNTTSTLLGTDIGNLTATTYFRAVVQNGTCAVANSDYATVSINSTTWDGSAWSNGAPIITTTAYMTGNYSEATDIFACTLTVSNNAVASIPSGYDVTLYGKLTVETGSSFTLNNNTNLLQQTEVTNTGIIKVKRNTIPMYRLDYNLWSSPVIGTQTLMDFSPLTSNVGPTNIRFYIYNTLTNLYNSVNATSTTFDTAKGYLIRMPNTWVPYSTSATAASWTGTFTGTPRNGSINYTLINTGDTTRFNAVGNPYPSTLLMNNFINGNSSSIEGTLWFWRKINDNNNLVSYSTCTTLGCTLNNNAIYTDSNFISIGQGFLVKAKTGQTTLNYNNSMRSNANVDQLFKYTTTEMDRYWIKLSNSNNLSAGQNLIAYIPEATTAYESGLDGLYLNDSAIAFYSLADTHEVVINARPVFDTNDIIPLTFKSNVADTYTFSINQKEGIFNGSQEVLLRDNYNNTIQNLTFSNYSFSTAAGIFTDRFDIIYQNQLNNSNPSLTSNAVIIYNNNQTTFIDSGKILMASLKVFDIRGRLLYQESNINDSKTSMKLNVANQVLLFEITTQNGEIITKKYIK
ncbi:hypothetical protein [Flavobacterium sp.]|jgi:hypothetical protein|uniref:hypothetical protein n=1 Tax=Flavobacterium sp. TaxID=239 RepID=UPI0037C12DFA